MNFLKLIIVALISFTFCINNLQSQTPIDTNIKIIRDGVLGVNFSTVTLKNWAGGGNNSISLNANGLLGYSYKDLVQSWNNILEGGYGVIKLRDEGFKKTDDKLIAMSKYGYKVLENLEYSALVDFRTQFTNGYDYNVVDSITGNYNVISKFMAPAYLTVGIGLNYLPTDFLSIFLAPLSNKVTFVLDDYLSSIGAFGVDKGQKFKSELGSSLDINFKKEILHNVNLQSRLFMFAPYKAFTTVFTTWDLNLNMKVNEYITAGFILNTIYDHNVNITREDLTVGPDTQIKYVILLGLTYKFNY